MPRETKSKPEAVTLERIEHAIVEAENGDADALRAILAPAPSWHTPARNLVGGDHLGQEQAVRFLRDQRELTRGTFHVEEVGEPLLRGDVGTLRLHATASRGQKRLDTQTRVRFRLEEGRVAELWTEPADGATWDAFWAP